MHISEFMVCGEKIFASGLEDVRALYWPEHQTASLACENPPKKQVIETNKRTSDLRAPVMMSCNYTGMMLPACLPV